MVAKEEAVEGSGLRGGYQRLTNVNGSQGAEIQYASVHWHESPTPLTVGIKIHKNT